jgi:hypothetical protein
MSTDMTESAYWLADHCPVPSPGRLFSGAGSTMGESGPGYVTTAEAAVVQPVGILTQGTVVNRWSGRAANPAIMAGDGKTEVLADLSVAAGSDENHDVVSGQLATDPGVGAVLDVSADRITWETDPGWTLGQFSTDGRYVVARGAHGELAVLDARHGERVTDVRPLGLEVFLVEVAWDVDDTLLGVVSDGHEEAIVRFDLGGHATLATPVRSVANATDVYRLAARP